MLFEVLTIDWLQRWSASALNTGGYMRSLSKGALSGVPVFIAVVIAIFTNSASADQYFETKRYSSLTPAHCQEFNIDFFKGPLTWVTYSIIGFEDAGFTHGVELRRHEASQLWRFIKKHKYVGEDHRWPITQSERGRYLLSILENFREKMGFTYGSEGEILEAFSLLDLSETYNPEEYFFTGGIEYSRGSGNVMGELDIIVARRSDCRVVVVGESKLGLHRLNKALGQLARFRNFVAGHINRKNDFRKPKKRRRGGHENYLYQTASGL